MPPRHYPCQGNINGLAIAVDTEADWKNFCTAIGVPEWLKDKRFADKATRLKHAQIWTNSSPLKLLI